MTKGVPVRYVMMSRKPSWHHARYPLPARAHCHRRTAPRLMVATLCSLWSVARSAPCRRGINDVAALTYEAIAAA